MKTTKIFGLAVVLMIVTSISFALEPNCEDWLGTWDVENADGTSSTWVIYDVPEDTGSSVILCQAFGKSLADLCAKPIQIFFISMTGYYSYSEDSEINMSMKEVEVTLNDAGDAFEVTGDDTCLLITDSK